jgi:uncharacterized membrane protein
MEHGRVPPEEPKRFSTLISRLILTFTVLGISLWLLLTPEGLLGKADAVGYAVCHRIDLRSFHLGIRELPLCARCTGMYLGALTTLIGFMLAQGKAGAFPSREIQIVLVGFAGLWVLDGLNSFLSIMPGFPNLYMPHNALRLLTGTLLGSALATMIYPVFIQSFWDTGQDQRVIPSWRWFLSLLGSLILIDLAILSENPLVLYPLALLSAVGVITLLTLAYSVLVMTFKRCLTDGSSWMHLWPVLTAGFLLALSQVAVIDLLRYWVTGTWDGFHF